jgi:hypothetical protein
MPLLVLDEHPVERLLEQRHVERIGENHVTVRVVRQTLHLEQSNLIETSEEDVNRVTVLRCPPRERLVELRRPLEVLDVVALDVVVRTDRLPQLDTDSHSRSLGRRSSREEHDASTGVGEGGLRGKG